MRTIRCFNQHCRKPYLYLPTITGRASLHAIPVWGWNYLHSHYTMYMLNVLSSSVLVECSKVTEDRVVSHITILSFMLNKILCSVYSTLWILFLLRCNNITHTSWYAVYTFIYRIPPKAHMNFNFYISLIIIKI